MTIVYVGWALLHINLRGKTCVRWQYRKIRKSFHLQKFPAERYILFSPQRDIRRLEFHLDRCPLPPGGAGGDTVTVYTDGLSRDPLPPPPGGSLHPHPLNVPFLQPPPSPIVTQLRSTEEVRRKLFTLPLHFQFQFLSSAGTIYRLQQCLV